MSTNRFIEEVNQKKSPLIQNIIKVLSIAGII